jgi:rhodanese-related sulfurtransferase
VTDAGRHIETYSGEEALKLVGDSDVIFVDVREGEELRETGKLKGALHVPRGFLEFHADPADPSHKPELGSGKKLVLYCASGNRSALGAKAVKDRGSRMSRMLPAVLRLFRRPERLKRQYSRYRLGKDYPLAVLLDLQ